MAAQRELVSLLDGAFDARRQRITVSSATVNWVKWASILALAGLTLVSIAFVHRRQPGAGDAPIPAALRSDRALAGRGRNRL